MRTLDVCEHLSLGNHAAAMGCYFHEFASEIGGDGGYLAPWGLYVAERFAFLVFLTDVGLYCRLAFAFALELPIDLSLHGCDDGICLGVLEFSNLLGREAGA